MTAKTSSSTSKIRRRPLQRVDARHARSRCCVGVTVVGVRLIRGLLSSPRRSARAHRNSRSASITMNRMTE